MVNLVSNGQDTGRLDARKFDYSVEKHTQHEPPKDIDDKHDARSLQVPVEGFNRPVDVARDAEIQTMNSIEDRESERTRQHDLHDFERRRGPLVRSIDVFQISRVVGYGFAHHCGHSRTQFLRRPAALATPRRDWRVLPMSTKYRFKQPVRTSWANVLLLV